MQQVRLKIKYLFGGISGISEEERLSAAILRYIGSAKDSLQVYRDRG